MAVQTAATTQRENAGSLTLYRFTFTSVADGDTFDSGLSTNVWGFLIEQTGNPSTQASAGISAANASGIFTLYPGENSLGATLFVFART
tara:strand:+ start:1295 stop:1561 length:267 start_codon:yes stop_codon:yes gene_type:complete